jgi:hypothetical protein
MRLGYDAQAEAEARREVMVYLAAHGFGTPGGK